MATVKMPSPAIPVLDRPTSRDPNSSKSIPTAFSSNMFAGLCYTGDDHASTLRRAAEANIQVQV